MKLKNKVEQRWVYGTRSEQWHLVGPADRDYCYGISQERFAVIGPEAAKAEYLSPQIVK